MQYLDAVFNESARYHTINGLAIDRVCRKPFDFHPASLGVKPFTVQPGMVVLIPAIAIHKDPKYYDDHEVVLGIV